MCSHRSLEVIVIHIERELIEIAFVFPAGVCGAGTLETLG